MYRKCSHQLSMDKFQLHLIRDCYYQSQLCWSEYHKWGDNFARVAKILQANDNTVKVHKSYTQNWVHSY